MKKHLVPILLILALLVGLLPGAALAAGPEQLYAWNPAADMSQVDKTDGPWTEWNGVATYGNPLHFSTDEEGNDLILSGTFTYTPDEGSTSSVRVRRTNDGFWNVMYEGVGTGTLSITVDGVTYAMKVTVELPSDGWCTAPEMTAASLVQNGEFSYTETAQTVYYVLAAGDEITKAEILPSSASYVSDITSSNEATRPYVAITLNSQAIDRRVQVMIQWENNGGNWGGTQEVRVVDGREKLAYTHVNGGNGEYREQSNFGNMDWIRLCPGDWQWVVFASCVGENNYTVLSDVTSVTSSDPYVLTASLIGTSDMGNPVYQLDAVDFGTATLTVTYGNGKTLSHTIEVTLPEDGWFTSSTVKSEDTYIPGTLVFETEIPDFYYHCRNDVTIEQVESVMGSQTAGCFDVQISKDHKYLIVSLREGEFCTSANLNIQYRDSEDWINWINIQVVQGSSGLVARMVESGEEIVGSHMYAGLSMVKDETCDISLYYYNGLNAKPYQLHGEAQNIKVDDSEIVTVEKDETTGFFCVTAKKEGLTELTVTYAGGETAVFPVAVEGTPNAETMNTVHYVDIAGDPYAVGFGSKITDVLWIMEDNATFGDTRESDTSSNYSRYKDIEVYAGVKGIDAQGAVTFTYSENMPISYEIKRAWIENLTGDDEVWSFSETTIQRVKTDFADGATTIPLYSCGQSERAMIHAELEVTCNGQTTTQHISVRAETFITDTQWITSQTIANTLGDVTAENVDVPEINRMLQVLAERPLTCETGYVFLLDGKDYTGTIQIPSNFKTNDNTLRVKFQGCEREGYQPTFPNDGSPTVLNGGIQLGWAAQIDDVYFCGTNATTSALFGVTALNVIDCTFTDYDIACDASDGMITLTSGNLLVNNGIAVRIDLADNEGGNLQNYANNTFINNETAVQVLSFNTQISSFNFRIHDCNFINNDTDFDVQDEGNVYFYANYFGRYTEKNGKAPTPGKQNANKNNDRDHLRLQDVVDARTMDGLNRVLISRPARVKTGSGTNLTTNPRWKYPVLDWWKSNVLINEAVFGRNGQNALATLSDEEDYVNYLTSDWDTDTEIVNDEADDLLIDEAAFDADGTKEVDVVNADSTSLEHIGTWTFEEGGVS